jgi:hypothetical protein
MCPISLAPDELSVRIFEQDSHTFILERIHRSNIREARQSVIGILPKPCSVFFYWRLRRLAVTNCDERLGGMRKPRVRTPNRDSLDR